MNPLLLFEVEVEIIQLLDIETLRKLYSLPGCYRELLSNLKTLESLRHYYRIISKVRSFPEFYYQWIIKYNPKESPFSLELCLDVGIKNDDVEAIKGLIEGSEDYVSNKAAKFGSERVLDYMMLLSEELFLNWGDELSYKTFVEYFDNLDCLEFKQLLSACMTKSKVFSEGNILEDFTTHILTLDILQYLLRDIFIILTSFDYSYEECARVCEETVGVISAQNYTHLAYAFISNNRMEDASRLIEEKKLTDELKKLLESEDYNAVDLPLSYKMHLTIGYKLDNFLASNILLTAESDLNKTSYVNSIYDIVIGLHTSIGGEFRVTHTVLAQSVASKDVLTVDYIKRHDLTRDVVYINGELL